MGFPQWKIRVALPREKPTATESRFSTYGAYWVVWCFHNLPNSDMDCKIFNVGTDVNTRDCTCGCRETRKIFYSESWFWEENPSPHRGNRICVSGVPVRRSTKWATFIPDVFSQECACAIFYYRRFILPSLCEPFQLHRSFTEVLSRPCSVGAKAGLCRQSQGRRLRPLKWRASED